MMEYSLWRQGRPSVTQSGQTADDDLVPNQTSRDQDANSLPETYASAPRLRQEAPSAISPPQPSLDLAPFFFLLCFNSELCFAKEMLQGNQNTRLI